MSKSLDFVKGHCGWDTLTLLVEGQVPPERELASALKILAEPVQGGLEVGFMGRGSRPDEVRLRMVDSTSRDWIPMCGGMSQVIGKALVETFLHDHFAVDIDAPRLHFKLLTPSGTMPIAVEVNDRRATRTLTTMDGFVSYLYERGVEPLTLNGCELLRVGHMLVIDLAALERAHPGLDFTTRRPGEALDIVNGMLEAYVKRADGQHGVVGMMYDDRPEASGQFRIYPRFYSKDMAAASSPYEFQCGTGTVAVGLALAYRGTLPFKSTSGSILFEWGSQRTTPDPYGVRTSQLNLTLQGARVRQANFSHSVVEILSEGKLTLPGY